MSMDYEKMFDKLVERFGKEELSRIIIKLGCPTWIPSAKYCEADHQECPGCWAKALGLEEETS
jgi:hypothetical protein